MPTVVDTKKLEKPVKPGKPAWLWPAVTIGGAVLVLAVSIVIYGMVGYKLIYPDVFTDDISLGGLTVTEANTVILQHIEAELAASTLTVTVGTVEDTFTPENTNVVYSAGDTAENAYAVGRTGNLFERWGEMGSAYFSRVDVPLTPALQFDESLVGDKIAAMAAKVDVPVSEYRYAISDTFIVVENAVNGYKLDKEAVRQGVEAAFANLDFSPLTYEPTVLEPQALDIAQIHKEVYREPSDAYLDTTDPTNAVIMPHMVGIDFDTQALEAALQTGLSTITIPLLITQPNITQETLKASLFRDELSTFTTSLSASNVPRTSNIRLAAKAINGTVLGPGDVFSFNSIVGQRTAARGYQEAGAYYNGRLVPEVGGGICQMSTTIYNAILLANLEVVERSNHNLTVGYVHLGLDAMINWGTNDLQFRNSTDYPLQILSEQVGSYVKVTFMGTKTTKFTVQMEFESISSTPMQRIERVNNNMAPGTTNVVQEGYNGSVWDTYRKVLDADGNVISRKKESRSSYRKVDKIVEVGPAPVEVAPDPTPVPTPVPADPTPTPIEPVEPTPETTTPPDELIIDTPWSA